MMPLHCRRSGPIVAAAVVSACASGSPALRSDPVDALEDAPTIGAVMSLHGPAASGAEPIRIEEYLRGRVPGLQIVTSGGAFSLHLRGAHNTLVGSQEPLVIIDGLPIAHELSNRVLRTVRPRDVREITVLRDVASTSVYGMRGAGGVILIRTIGR